jgi:peptide/nickel transport system permease protein
MPKNETAGPIPQFRELQHKFDVEAPSPFQIMRRRAMTHPGLIFGATMVFIAAICALFADAIAPYDPLQQDIVNRLKNPVWGEGGGWAHPLGTDAFGRDYLSRLIHGTRISMAVGFFAAGIAACVGTVVGIIGGYFGGRVDALVMYLISTKLALPGLVVMLALVSIFGGTLLTLILVMAALFWDRYAIVVRTITMQLRTNEFVTAAEAIGASKVRIMLGEILPNLLNQVIVILTLEMAIAILIEAALSFLGLGIPPPTPSWGNLTAEGREFMFFQPFLVTIPGVVILVLAIAINMMGDGIRDVTSPEGRN